MAPETMFTEDERPAAAASRLALALDAAEMGDWTWEPGSDLVRLSSRAREILGLPSGASITRTAMRELLHPDDRERARIANDEAIASRNDYQIEYRILLPDGTIRWVQARGRTLYNGEGIRGMLGVVADITPHKELEASLRQRSEILQTLNEVGLLVAGELDQDRLIKAVTDAGTRMAGAEFGAFFYNVTSAEGASYMLYSLSGVDRAHFERFPMPRATPLFGPTFEGQATIRLDDVRADPRYGQWGPHHGMPAGHLPVRSYLAVPVLSRQGNVLGGLFFGHSKTGMFSELGQRAIEGLAGYAGVALDNARLVERAQQATSEAEHANRLKDEFLATLSHELRTPLNAVLGWAHLLRTGRLGPEDHARAVDTIERNARVQGQIIADILDVSRIITGKLRLDVAPVRLASVVEAALESVRPSAQAKHIRMLSTLDDGATTVMGDEARLQQIVWNLLANAVKFTPRDGRVHTVLEREDSHAVLTIADNGEGIDAETLPHIFERFRQADSSTTREHGGLGLGLAIVRHLVEQHGGTVRAESAGKGFGATFLVRIPVAAVRREPEAEALRTPSIAHAAIPDDPAPSMDLAGTRILAVDDDHSSREFMTAMLGSYGAQVVTADGAASALGMLSADRYDLLISDLGMPGEDGFSLLRKLRGWTEVRGGRTPAIALTAYARPEDRVRSLAAGFQAHLSKPVDPAELIATIASVLGRRLS